MIRPFNFLDILLIKELQGEGMQLDLERALLWPHTPLMAALSARIPFREIGALTYVLDAVEGGERQRGFAQVRARRSRAEWDIVYLAPSPSKRGDVHTVWERLITHLCAEGGERGILRLFAKPPEEREGLEAFLQLGFSVYAREEIFRLARVPSDLSGCIAAPLRPQRADDAWELQRLYRDIAPQPVRLAEGDWGSPLGEGYILEDERGIVGHLRLINGKRAHWLKMLLHPKAQGQADEPLRFGLSLLMRYPPCPIYCGARGYETGLRDALERSGFRPFARRSLLVKHTTARVKEPSFRLVPGLKKGIEAAPTVSQINKG